MVFIMAMIGSGGQVTNEQLMQKISEMEKMMFKLLQAVSVPAEVAAAAPAAVEVGGQVISLARQMEIRRMAQADMRSKQGR